MLTGNAHGNALGIFFNEQNNNFQITLKEKLWLRRTKLVWK